MHHRVTAILCCLLLSSCKHLPNTFRTGTRQAPVSDLVALDTIQFRRLASGTEGTFSFSLKAPHFCRIEYWGDKTELQPSSRTPMSLDCPNDGKTSNVSFQISGLDKTNPLTFKIMAWPRAVSYLDSYFHEFKESPNFQNVVTDQLIIVRSNVPRQSSELYAHQLDGKKSLADIKQMTEASYAQGTEACTEGAEDTTAPYLQKKIDTSDEYSKKLIESLGVVSTEGYGEATAYINPADSAYLNLDYNHTEPVQNWRWKFSWADKPQYFEVYPPSRLVELEVRTGVRKERLKNKKMSGSIQAVVVDSEPFTVTTSILFPNIQSQIELVAKTLDASKVIFRCHYSPNAESLSIPKEFYQKIAKQALITITLESSQISHRNDTSGPPWIITAQDWIHFVITKGG